MYIVKNNCQHKPSQLCLQITDLAIYFNPWNICLIWRTLAGTAWVIDKQRTINGGKMGWRVLKLRLPKCSVTVTVTITRPYLILCGDMTRSNIESRNDWNSLASTGSVIHLPTIKCYLYVVWIILIDGDNSMGVVAMIIYRIIP